MFGLPCGIAGTVVGVVVGAGVFVDGGRVFVDGAGVFIAGAGKLQLATKINTMINEIILFMEHLSFLLDCSSRLKFCSLGKTNNEFIGKIRPTSRVSIPWLLFCFKRYPVEQVHGHGESTPDILFIIMGEGAWQFPDRPRVSPFFQKATALPGVMTGSLRPAQYTDGYLS